MSSNRTQVISRWLLCVHLTVPSRPVAAQTGSELVQRVSSFHSSWPNSESGNGIWTYTLWMGCWHLVRCQNCQKYQCTIVFKWVWYIYHSFYTGWNFEHIVNMSGIYKSGPVVLKCSKSVARWCQKVFDLIFVLVFWKSCHIYTALDLCCLWIVSWINIYDSHAFCNSCCGEKSL